MTQAPGLHAQSSLPPVLVLGLCKHGLYLTRTFERHGVPVYAIERDFSQHSAKTKFGRKIPCVDMTGQALIDKLVELKRQLPAPVVVFPTNDKMVDLLLQNHDLLADHYRFPFLPGPLLARLKDKGTLHQIASDAGLNVPLSILVEDLAQLGEVEHRIRLPVALKPVLPMSSFKSMKCTNLAALRTQVSKSQAIGEPLIVQDWIEGDDRQILFGAYHIGRDGQCLAKFGGRKLMSYPPLTGHAAAAEGFDVGPLLEEGYRFLRDLGFRGLCSVEYKGRPDSSARFIEVTVGRCDWWIMVCEINGVNLPLAAYSELAGVNPPFENEQRNRYIWHDLECSLPVLFENVVARRWRLGEVLAYLLKPKKEALLDWGDLGPFLALLSSGPARALRVLGNRLGRQDT